MLIVFFLLALELSFKRFVMSEGNSVFYSIGVVAAHNCSNLLCTCTNGLRRKRRLICNSYIALHARVTHFWLFFSFQVCLS